MSEVLAPPPSNLDALVAAPPGYTTWDGPYINTNFLQSAYDYKKDAWGVLYTYNGGVTITSTGSGDNITRQLANAASDLTSNIIQGTVLDAESVPPGLYSGSVNISISYPDGTGSTTTTTINPSAGGNYTFTNIPIGNHALTTVNTTTNDTVFSYVTFPPKSTVVDNIRFGSALWAAGSASSGDALQYVAGSAKTTGAHGENVEFKIFNDTGQNITISWLEATYTHSPTAYYEEVKWGLSSVANQTSPRFASGDRADFSSSKAINNGSTKTVELRKFNTAQSGGGSDENMANSSFTVLFSDGSTISFDI